MNTYTYVEYDVSIKNIHKAYRAFRKRNYSGLDIVATKFHIPGWVLMRYSNNRNDIDKIIGAYMVWRLKQ